MSERKAMLVAPPGYEHHAGDLRPTSGAIHAAVERARRGERQVVPARDDAPVLDGTRTVVSQEVHKDPTAWSVLGR